MLPGNTCSALRRLNVGPPASTRPNQALGLSIHLQLLYPHPNCLLVLQVGAFLRSLVDANKHQMAEVLLKRLQKDNPQAYRKCQKHFWSMDQTIKVQMFAGSCRRSWVSLSWAGSVKEQCNGFNGLSRGNPV